MYGQYAKIAQFLPIQPKLLFLAIVFYNLLRAKSIGTPLQIKKRE